jgi:hypothetical protein
MIGYSRKIAAVVLIGLALLGTAGCRAFSDYPDQMRYVRNAFADGAYAQAACVLEENPPAKGEHLLYKLELGEVRRAAGRFDESNQALLGAGEIIREQDERAVISIRDTAAVAASLLVNDRLRPYEAPLYERVLLHTALCSNFLLKGDFDGARVEVRQAYEDQKAAREKHEKEIAKTRREAENQQVNLGAVEGRIADVYKDQEGILREAGNLYQNLYTYYLSSLIYEMNGEYSDAYIDAKTIYAQRPGFGPVRDALPRYAKALGLRADYDKWRETFGESAAAELPPEYGEIVLLFECGMAPVKEEVRFAVPVPMKDHWNLVTVAIPKYRLSKNPVDGARLVVNGTAYGDSQPLMDVEAAALLELRDRALGIALRHVIRGAAKLVVTEQIRKNQGEFAYIIAVLAGSALERADLRSWITLPKSLQALRTGLPEGKHDMVIQLTGRGAVQGTVCLRGVEVRRGRLTIISLRSTGVHGTAYVVNY